jgi:hypothetical protein
MSQCFPGCDLAAANRTICRKPSSYVENRTICRKPHNLLLYLQQWPSQDLTDSRFYICRKSVAIRYYMSPFFQSIIWVATDYPATANPNICRKLASYVANRKSAAILTQPDLTDSRL